MIWSLVTRTGQRRNTYRIVVGTPQGKRQLRKARRRWNYNSTVYLKEVARSGLFKFIRLRVRKRGGLIRTRK